MGAGILDPLSLRKELNIVIVDDFPTMTRAMKTILSNNLGFNGHNIKLIYGDDAAEQLLRYLDSFDTTDENDVTSHRLPNAIFLDWYMPSLPGIEALKKIRASTNPIVAEVMVVMVTAENAREQIMEAIKAGVSSFIVKPPNVAEVEKKLGDLAAIELHKAKKLLNELESGKATIEMSVEDREKQITEIITRTNTAIALDVAGDDAQKFKLELTERYFEYFNRVSHRKAQNGDQSAAKGKYSGAISLYIDALKLNPSDHLVRIALGKMHMKNTDYGKAILNFAAALDVVPNDAGILELLGEAQLKQAHATDDKELYAQAVKNFRHASQLPGSSKTRAKTLAKLGDALEGEDNPEAALKERQKAIELGSVEVAHLINMGVALKKAGRNKEAEEALRKAAELTPKNPEDMIGMGKLWLEKNDKQKAMHFFQTAIKEISKEDLELYEEMIIALLGKDMIEEALPLIANVSAKRPDLFNLLGLAYSRRGEIDEAINAYDEAIEKDSTGEREGYFYNRGMANIKKGFQSKAKDDFMQSYMSNTDFQPAKDKLKSLGVDSNAIEIADPAMVEKEKRDAAKKKG